jgi:hypothetical protein
MLSGLPRELRSPRGVRECARVWVKGRPLIYLFGREEHDRLHADHASSSYGQRDGGRIRVVRHVKDEISGVFAEGPSIMLAYMLSEHPITP